LALGLFYDGHRADHLKRELPNALFDDDGNDDDDGLSKRPKYTTPNPFTHLTVKQQAKPKMINYEIPLNLELRKNLYLFEFTKNNKTELLLKSRTHFKSVANL